MLWLQGGVRSAVRGLALVPQELLHNMWQQPRRAECSGKALPRGMHCIVALCACTGLTYTQAPIYPLGVCCCRPTCVQRTSLTSSGSTRPAGRARQLGTVCCAIMHDAWCGTPMAHQVHLHWAHPQCCWAVCCILILNVKFHDVEHKILMLVRLFFL